MIAFAAVLLSKDVALRGVERGSYLRLVKHLQLGNLRFIEVANLGDRRLLRICHRRGRDAGIGVFFGKALHRELERRLQRLFIGHCSVPFRTQVVLPIVTVRSVKKFHRT